MQDQSRRHMHIQDPEESVLDILHPSIHVHGLIRAGDDSFHLCHKGLVVQIKALFPLMVRIFAKTFHMLYQRVPEDIQDMLEGALHALSISAC